METAPTYRIMSQNGTVIATDLPRSAPVIQLQEGTLSKGDKPPKELSAGESCTVVYPLVHGCMVCRVTRTVEGIVPTAADELPIEFVEPDPLPTKSKPIVSQVGAKAASDAIAEVKTARRGRAKKVTS